ncbi:MAG: hypothetical protein GX893_01275 [Firmicutes bacterium]|nr:hypothetical protein [Bacillota bacterium]
MSRSGIKQEREEQLKFLARLLEAERERLVRIIKEHGIISKEAFLQSHVVDRLVILYMQRAGNDLARSLTLNNKDKQGIEND